MNVSIQPNLRYGLRIFGEFKTIATQLWFIFYILINDSLKQFHPQFENNFSVGFDCYQSTKIRYYLHLIKE